MAPGTVQSLAHETASRLAQEAFETLIDPHATPEQRRAATKRASDAYKSALAQDKAQAELFAAAAQVAA
jgi:hypothetical protein